jgi:signal transduction histidine kinase
MFWRLVLTRTLALLVLALLAAPLLLPDTPLVNVLVFSLLLAVLSVVPVWLLNQRFAGALRRVSEAATAIGRGETATRAYVGAPEVRETAQALNLMAERLAERIDHLEDDRSRLSAVLDGMIEGVVALDVAERIVFANARAGQLFDFDPARDVS